jgi:cyclase
VGDVHLELLHTEIHSDDAVVVWWPEQGLLLCGDTMEDTVTYVDEPARLPVHRQNLELLRELAPGRILPNHGDPDVIAGGGYSSGLIAVTQRYIDLLLEQRGDASLRNVVDSLASDDVHYYEPYERVHRHNVELVRAT